jgi:hypothetical protein
MIEQLRGAELERLFADWSVPVIVQRVDQGLDSDFDEVSESETNFEIDAVQLPLKSSPTARTSMQHVATECDFLMRAIDLPGELSLTSCRILAAGRIWSVIQVTRSADGQVVQLRGQAT